MDSVTVGSKTIPTWIVSLLVCALKKTASESTTAPLPSCSNPLPIPSEYSLLDLTGCGCLVKWLSISSPNV